MKKVQVNESDALFGLDLHNELARVRAQNRALVKGIGASGLAALIGVVFGLVCLVVKPSPARVAIDPAGRLYPVVEMSKNELPDSRVTRFAGDCIYNLLNHAFHNYQNTFERAVSTCTTSAGIESVRLALYPRLEDMKKYRMNLASNFLIQPFVNSRTVEFGRLVYHIQGTIQIGYRGTNASINPVEYAFSADFVRVPFESSVEGIRMQNIVLAIR